MVQKQLFSSVVVSILFLALPPSAQGACETLGVDRTFVQLWRRDAARSATQWDKWFQDLERLGFSEVVIQWSSYGPVVYYADDGSDREFSPSLEALVEAAGRQGMKVWLGLHYDPDFWQAIRKDPQGPGAYLRQRLKAMKRTLPFLLRSIQKADPRGKIVKGWYISDEVDDQNWRATSRRSDLIAYLRDLRAMLRRKKSSWPVMISGFCNGTLPPQQWTSFWNELLLRTGIDGFWFQDGIGAGKLTMQELKNYLLSFSKSFIHGQRSFGVIVELFQSIPDAVSPFRSQAAEFDRVRRQLSLARTLCRTPVSVFSAPDYLMSDGAARAAVLRRDWLKSTAACQKATKN